MGSHCRYQGAILIAAILLIVSGQSQAATRQYVALPPAGAAVKSNTGSPVTSNGTLRVDGPIQGEYIPRTGSGTKGVPIKVQPRYDFSIPRTIKHAKDGLRFGWPGMAASVGIGFALDQMDAWLDPLLGVPIKLGDGDVVPGDLPMHYKWIPHSQNLGSAPTPHMACVLYENMESTTDYYEFSHLEATASSGLYNCYLNRFRRTDGKHLEGPSTSFAGWSNSFSVRLSGSECPLGSTWDGVSCRGEGAPRAFTDADYDLLGDIMNRQNAEWLRDLLRDVCESSPSPSRCFDEMLERTALSGPATLSGPTTTSTTTTTAADGTQQQTTTTTKTEYNIRYGDNYFDYSERKTSTITHPDGSTSQEVTEEPETETPSQEEPAYSVQDSDFPEVGPFYEQKYPDGLQGVWSNASAQLNDSAFMSFLNSFVPNFSGSCPSWSMSFDIASWASYGSHNFPSLCYVFDFIKVIILVSAAFLCRSIIFGG